MFITAYVGKRFPVLLLLGLSLIIAGCQDEGGRKSKGPENDSGDSGEVSSELTEFEIVPQLKDRSVDSPLHAVFKKTEPKEDPGWDTEVLADHAKNQLKMMGKLLLDGRPTEGLLDSLQDYLDPGFSACPLRPGLDQVFSDGPIQVYRKSDDPADEKETGFLLATKGWIASFSKDKRCDDETLRWKIVRVDSSGKTGAFGTGVRLEVDGLSPIGERLSQLIELDCDWVGKETPLLKSWRVVRFEEVILKEEGDAKAAAPFVDHTAAIMADCASFDSQLARGTDYWYGNFDVAFGIQQGNQGISVCDVNGDGREDLFVCQPAGLLSRLYLQNPDGTLRDFTRESGLTWLDDARSALFVDLDGDGDEDLAWGLGYSLTIHENDGTGRFRLRVEIDMFSWPTSVAAADYDLDGDLDLYVCGYTSRNDVAPGDVFANPVPYHDANNGARNLFVKNEGDFDFADITAKSGFSQNNRRFSFAAGWEDFDLDGDQDLYVANDFGRNNLYRNELQADGSRRFVDVAADAGVEDIAAGMSVSWGDVNRDGLMDVYVSNMFSSAGGRIAFQQHFQDSADDLTRAQLQRHARGNTLYQNQGNGTFTDISLESGTNMGRWAWASHFVDLNNDAWEDLFVANGFYTAEDSGDL